MSAHEIVPTAVQQSCRKFWAHGNEEKLRKLQEAFQSITAGIASYARAVEAGDGNPTLAQARRNVADHFFAEAREILEEEGLA